MNRAALQQLALAWRRHLWLRTLVLSALAAELGYLLAGPLGTWPLGLVAMAALVLHARPWRIQAPALAAHLDRSIPELEESSALWLREPTELGTLEALQRARLDAAFTPARRRAQEPPGRQLIPLFLAAVALPLVLAGLHYVPPLQRPSAPAVSTPRVALPSPPAPRLELQLAELLVTPPGYTGRPARRLEGLEGEVEVGALVEWRLRFDRAAPGLRLQFAGGLAELPLEPQADAREVRAQLTVETLLVYSIATAPGTPALTGTHVLRVLPDRPPALVLLEPARTRTELAAPAPVRIALRATDDYGLASVWLVATVAKGSGESVKFREQKFELTAGEGGAFETTLDLAALGLGAGDELYFHAEALDRRTPTPNLARSETRFVSIRGGGPATSATARGVVAVNLVPEYFRSQRQLIIDTEKLIAERPQLAEKPFRERANDLGIDQQLLRLRYGRFLGEEAEGDLVPTPATSGQTNAAGIPESMIHRHDTASDHYHPGAAPPKDGEKKEPPKDAREVVAGFVHQHDSQEQATFFDHQTKGTLRDVLRAMWESEGFLRQAKPAESLPAQYRALAILKYLQQGDRAYVQRVGFEAAPLKVEERRLQGDISTVARFGRLTPPPPAPAALVRAVATALAAVDFTARRALRPTESEALRAVEGALAPLAADGGEPVLVALQEVRAALRPSPAGVPAALEPALRALLPPAQARPAQAIEPAPGLAERFARELQTAPNR
ncbi:MAG: hypothetical protein JSR82_06555 [Verrucomicrobia bacterium]|nr:hypothetical protein [Verrucomicrobiota bacterium]